MSHVLKGSFITARKRSLGQGNVLSSVCQGFCPRGGGGVCGDGRGAWRGGMPGEGACVARVVRGWGCGGRA